MSIGSQPALSEIDLDVVPGSIAAVVGGDGAGKTTLARVLGRLIPFESGKVVLPDRSAVGYQPASSGSWPDLTVAENLHFVADVYRLGPAEKTRRLDGLLGATGLEDARDRLAAHLSGGMRQKLGVAMALVARPLILVLDEPTTGVDPVSRSELWRLISRSAAEGTAVVMTTTYLDEAARASHILALEAGVEIVSGAPEAILNSVPGPIWRTSERPTGAVHRWRRGSQWHYWSDDGSFPSGAQQVEPDLTDILTARTLMRQRI
ncbi:MAG: ABC transporter ATP-binding protein [Acidimicrobiia bacterium]